jgi:hypothetical protein
MTALQNTRTAATHAHETTTIVCRDCVRQGHFPDVTGTPPPADKRAPRSVLTRPSLWTKRKRHSGPTRGTRVHRHDVVACELAIGRSSSTVAFATRHEQP